MTNKEALKQKQQQFDELVKDVSNCRICRHLYFPLGCPDGEYLDHSDHPGYLNAWNLQACDLMASCMILGQDFGVLLDEETLQEGGFPERIIRQATKNRQFLSTTDKNVRSLLHIPDPQQAPDAPLKGYFFTNTACCYRQKGNTTEYNPSWYSICAYRFLGRLIRIIQPKVIIALGKEAFNALSCCQNAAVAFPDDLPYSDGRENHVYRDLISLKKPFKLSFEDSDLPPIDVYPVFHPSMMKLNQPAGYNWDYILDTLR